MLRNTFLSHAGVRLLLGAAAVAALSLALRRRGPLLVGLAFTGFMILLPALAGVHARYLYLPSLAAVPALLAWLALTLLHRPPEPVNRASPRRRALVVVLVLMICGGYLAGAVNRQRAWAEASRLSGRFVANLASAVETDPGRRIHVINAPFTLRGASIAANWRKALRLTHGMNADVRVLNSVRVPHEDWEGPRVEVRRPGEFTLHLEPGPHAALHYPGDAGERADRVQLPAGLVVVRRDPEGRAVALEISLDPNVHGEGSRVVVWSGHRLETPGEGHERARPSP